EMVDDPQVQHNDMIIEIDEPDVGSYETTGFPVDMSETPASVERPPPRVGEHTREVLREAGYDDALIAELVDEGVVEAFDG
ncbi:MAG: CoA transferase, partial [Haloarculaceae archaeon]